MTKQETPMEKQNREMVEEIASNIASLSRGVSAILGGRLKKKSIIILLAHTTSLPKYQVEKVLDALANMEKDHLNKTG